MKTHKFGIRLTKSVEEAKALDTKAAEAWVGHPYMDLVDNDGSNFESKINSLISKKQNKLWL